MRGLTAILPLLGLFSVAIVQAEETDPPVVKAADAGGEMSKQAIVSALAFLDGSGAKLEKGSSCINCHHAPLRGWALREAARLGVDVDASALQEVTARQLERLSEVKDAYRDKQWGHSLSTFFVLGSGDDVAKSLSTEAVEELTQIIVAEQSSDGSWKAAQQFGNQRRPKKDANEVQTMWSVLALSRLGANKAAVEARDKGLVWLKSAESGATIDARALRLIVEQRFGEASRSDELLERLLKTQREDGGWGWQPEDTSEAWPTGLVLYALSSTGKKASAPAITKARQYLVTSQKEDGSWFVEGKLTKNSEMASYFGTAWAIVGLSRTGAEK